jgi:hypothetical protein
MNARTLRRLVVVTVVLTSVGALAASEAGAYLSASGDGAGTAATGTTVAVSLSPGTPTSTLYPGGHASVTLTVSNPNFSPVRVGSLALATTQGTGGFSVDGGHPSCAVAALGFTTQTNGGSGWTVGKKVGAVNGTASITLTNALEMATSAANACQGATFTVYLAAGP